MATGTLHGESKKGGAKGMHPVRYIFDSEFFRYASTLDLLRVQSIETGREDLIPCGIGYKISGNLFGHKLIVCLIFTKRLNHPVPPLPDISVTIHLIAISVGISSHIQPFGSHPLGILVSIEELIDHFFVGILRCIRQKSVHIIQRGRKSGKVISDSS